MTSKLKELISIRITTAGRRCKVKFTAKEPGPRGIYESDYCNLYSLSDAWMIAEHVSKISQCEISHTDKCKHPDCEIKPDIGKINKSVSSTKLEDCYLIVKG